MPSLLDYRGERSGLWHKAPHNRALKVLASPLYVVEAVIWAWYLLAVGIQHIVYILPIAVVGIGAYALIRLLL